MKKLFISLLAVAALAACTKSEVAYEQTQDEIGFVAVANTITKAPVSGTAYPTTLNMYVNAFVNATSINVTTPDYFANVLFRHKSDNKWGGVPAQYWPNETALRFSGYSKSGNISDSKLGSYNPKTDELIITGYEPGTSTAAGANDLMWFPATRSYTKSEGKSGVTAQMYHTCSWITFRVQGDEITSDETRNYTIKTIKINGIDLTADVKCTGNASLAQTTLSNYVKWTVDETPTGTYDVPVVSGGVSLEGTYTAASGNTPASYSPKNVENVTNSNPGNVVVIPQTPRSVDITWTYTSQAGAEISDKATNLPLTLGDGQNWEPGKHYVYTITLKATEILITPQVSGWESGSGSVTIQ